MGRKIVTAERRISVLYLVGQANSKIIPYETDTFELDTLNALDE